MEYWLWGVFALALLLIACRISAVINFYVRNIYYLLCLVIAGTIGALISVPFGRTPDNHYRMFDVFHVFTWPLGFSFSIRHKERTDNLEGPYIVIANHQTAIDVLALTYMWPKNCVVMLKSSLKYLPGFNFCAFLCNALFIDRFSKEKAHKTLDRTVEAIQKDKRRVWIFPEGTRNNARKMLPFKKGAFVLAHKLRVPLVCLVFSSHRRFYDWDTYTLSGGHVEAEFLPPVDSTKFETVDELTDHCHKLMQDALDKLNAEVDRTYQS